MLIDGELATRPGWLLPPHRRGVGMVFQGAALWPHLNVAQNVLFGLNGMPGRHARQRVREVT